MAPELAPLIAVAIELLVLGAFVVLAAGVLGYLSRRWDGAFFLGTMTFMVPFVCVTGYALFGFIGYLLESPESAQRVTTAQGWAAVGLVLSILIVALLGSSYARSMGGSDEGKRRGARFLPALWLGFCFAGWIGHLAGGLLGILTVTFPAVAMFWVALYYVARHILPLGQDQPTSQALRSLLTFSLGTNYPYYAIDNRDKIERVAGKQTGVFLSGPGIFLTGPDHVIAVASGMQFQGVRGPGVVFTHKAEFIQEPMDLRPQQRSFFVEAVTKDGIPVKFNAAGPFQLDPDGKEPELGKPFPFKTEAIFRAFHARPIDIKRQTIDGELVEERERRRWDELYEMTGTHVMQDIISEYTFDELSESTSSGLGPREEIASEYQQMMDEELSEHGIVIPGGGVSNLLPAEEERVLDGRITGWQGRWQRQMAESAGETEAEVERILSKTRSQVRAEMIKIISEALVGISSQRQDVIISTVSMRFLEALRQMVKHPSVRSRLTDEVVQTVETPPIIIGGQEGDQDV
jgi:hypothetical protein